jgi:hypothetical protein
MQLLRTLSPAVCLLRLEGAEDAFGGEGQLFDADAIVGFNLAIGSVPWSGDG